jgi:hypothetical protein
MDIDPKNTRVEQIGLEGGDIFKPRVTVQMLESMEEKSNQDHEKFQQITEMYGALTQAVKYAGVCE